MPAPLDQLELNSQEDDLEHFRAFMDSVEGSDDEVPDSEGHDELDNEVDDIRAFWEGVEGSGAAILDPPDNGAGGQETDCPEVEDTAQSTPAQDPRMAATHQEVSRAPTEVNEVYTRERVVVSPNKTKRLEGLLDQRIVGHPDTGERSSGGRGVYTRERVVVPPNKVKRLEGLLDQRLAPSSDPPSLRPPRARLKLTHP